MHGEMKLAMASLSLAAGKVLALVSRRLSDVGGAESAACQGATQLP